MKLALQLGMLPGETVRDQAQWAADHGVEGLELGVWGGGLAKVRREAEQINGILPISAVCGNADPDGNPSFDYLDPDIGLRRRSIEGSRDILTFCGEVGAVGQVAPPIFGSPKVPDLSPWKTPLELEDELMLAACRELGPHAAEHGVWLMLEPLNRYEQHYLRRLRDAVRVIDRSQQPGVALLADLFHMHIEEFHSPEALREAGSHIKEVHLADNTRMEPGTGDIDFVAAFRALLDIGFDGYLTYECGVTGDTPDERSRNLARSLEFVRGCIAQARQQA